VQDVLCVARLVRLPLHCPSRSAVAGAERAVGARQIGYSTVFFWEYFGPLVTYALFYFFPRVFYPGYKCVLHSMDACMRLSRKPACGFLDSLQAYLKALQAFLQPGLCSTDPDCCVRKAVSHAAGAEPSLVHVVRRLRWRSSCSSTPNSLHVEGLVARIF
jgi:hypothetical protein